MATDDSSIESFEKLSINNLSSIDMNEEAGPSTAPPKQPKRAKFVCSPKVNYSDFNIHIVTWNIASGEPSPADIESLFLPQAPLLVHDLYNTADIIVVGLQEAYQSVGDAVSSNIPLVGKDPLVDLFSVFMSDKGFARLSFSRLLGMLTIVFIKRPLLCYIRNVETLTYKTGFNGILGNKGSSSVRFTLGDLSVCLSNCHLIPHPENNERRSLELRDILEKQEFSYSNPSRLMEHDVLVLFGDLNFRLEGLEYHDVVTTLASKGYKGLLQHDQLIKEQKKGPNSPSWLYSFMEMNLEFPPSYKYEPDTDNYHDGNKGRAPAWTDRILWKTHLRRLPLITDSEPRMVLKPSYYGMLRQPRLSDHKAVSAGIVLSVDISMVSLMVVFRLNEWLTGREALISFDVLANTQVSLFDWIGLYHANFSDIERDYVLYFYTPARHNEHSDVTYSKTVPANQVPSPGQYVLVYKSSHYGCVLGMSPVFRVTSHD